MRQLPVDVTAPACSMYMASPTRRLRFARVDLGSELGQEGQMTPLKPTYAPCAVAPARADLEGGLVRSWIGEAK